MPMEPVSIDASSDRMSPNMLPVTITSNCLGALTSCMAALSTSMWDSSTSGSPCHFDHHHVAPELGAFQHVHLVSLEQTFLSRFCAAWKATRPDAADFDSLYTMVLKPTALAVFAARRGLAEVDVAGQFADDQDVSPATTSTSGSRHWPVPGRGWPDAGWRTG